MIDPRTTRRAFLRGSGVCMALPALHSLPWPRPARARDEVPIRLAVVFCGNGFHSRGWWAKGEGAAMELGAVLAPLHALREKLVLIRGLLNEQAQKGNIHSSQTGNLLSGAPLAAGGEVRSGTSIDQLLAQRLGQRTRLPSLVLGCEKSNPSVHKNYSMLYSSHVSWSSPTTPSPLEIHPALAFDSLFSDGSEKGDASVLDAVGDDARRTRARLGREDLPRFDEYLESVRELERRIERAGAAPRAIPADATRPPDGLPESIGEHMRLMCDVLALGFRTDTTRFATLKLNNDHSSLRFKELGVDSMIHHLLSHTDSADWLKVNQFFVGHLAYLAQRLDELREGEHSVLDRTLLVFLSSMMTGNHDADRLPIALLGGAATGIRGGRVLDYEGQGERQACRLYLSLAARCGLELPAFGDARSPLTGL